MPKRDVVVIGASAGGVESLRELLGQLPPDFPAAIAVVLHVPATGTSALPHILSRVGPLEARHAASGDALRPGEVLIAPPDSHLLVYDHAVTLSHGPRENGHRPAIDVLFRTAARALGPRVLSVVLSGALDDGAAGSVAIKLRGGGLLVQDPDDALVPSMPRATIAATVPDHVAPVRKLAGLMVEMVEQDVPDWAPPASTLMLKEIEMAEFDAQAPDQEERPGTPAGFSCPDCAGTLFEIQEGGLVRYRCRVGHAWSPESLVVEQAAGLEGALWMALRTLEEKAALARRLGERARKSGHQISGEKFDGMAEEAQDAAVRLRTLIDRISDGPGAAEAPAG